MGREPGHWWWGERHLQETAVGSQGSLPLTWRTVTWEMPLPTGPLLENSKQGAALEKEVGWLLCFLLPRDSASLLAHTMVRFAPRPYTAVWFSIFQRSSFCVFMQSTLFNHCFILSWFLKLIQSLEVFFPPSKWIIILSESVFVFSRHSKWESSNHLGRWWPYP